MSTARVCCEINCSRTAQWELDYGEPGHDPYSQSDSCDTHLAELARGFVPVVTIVPLTETFSG